MNTTLPMISSKMPTKLKGDAVGHGTTVDPQRPDVADLGAPRLQEKKKGKATAGIRSAKIVSRLSVTGY